LRTEYFQIDLTNTYVKEIGWQQVDDSECNGNKDEKGTQEKSG